MKRLGILIACLSWFGCAAPAKKISSGISDIYSDNNRNESAWNGDYPKNITLADDEARQLADLQKEANELNYLEELNQNELK